MNVHKKKHGPTNVFMYVQENCGVAKSWNLKWKVFNDCQKDMYIFAVV